MFVRMRETAQNRNELLWEKRCNRKSSKEKYGRSNVIIWWDFFMKIGMMLSWEEKVISSNDQWKIRTDKETNFVASSDSRFFISREPELFLQNRIPTVKLKIPGKSIFEIRNQNFCYIQVIVFDLSYLPVAAVGT